MSEINVGDELAIKSKYGWRIPDKWDRAVHITDEIREAFEKKKMAQRLNQCLMWEQLTIDQLRRIVAILDEGK